MTEFFVAVVTAIASFATTRSWPTLDRRVRDHTALLKDMPPDVAIDLKALLAAEVDQLVVRESRRLDRMINILLNIRRAAWIAAPVGLAWTSWLMTRSDRPSLYALGAAFTVTALSLMALPVSGRLLRKTQSDVTGAVEGREA